MISHVISPSVKFKVPHALLLAFVLGFDAQTGPAAPQSDKPDLIQTFPVGRYPLGIISEGENIWVSNSGDDTVTKLRGSDGFLLGTFPVKNGPAYLAFDGSSIWVADSLSNNVTKLRASDGTLEANIKVGATPYGMAFDGANIWVTNYSDASVTKIRVSDDTVLGTFPVGQPYPKGILFDGTDI